MFSYTLHILLGGDGFTSQSINYILIYIFGDWRCKTCMVYMIKLLLVLQYLIS